MESKLRAVVEILKELNSKTNIVTKGDIDEQYDNLKDFKVLSGELDEMLNGFKSIDLNDGNEVSGMLGKIHVILTTFEWHFSEISDLNSEIGKEYKEKINID